MRLYLATEQAKHTTAAGRRVGLLHGWACTSALTGCMERVGGWGAACLAYGSYLSSYRFGSGQALRGTPNPNRCLGWCWECFGLELGLDALGTHMWCTCVSLIAAQARLFRSHAADERTTREPLRALQITRLRLRIALAGYAGDAGRSGGSSACAASYS